MAAESPSELRWGLKSPKVSVRMNGPHASSRPSFAQRGVRWGSAALAFALCLCGVSAEDPTAHDVHAQPPAAAARCQVIQKRPLFVAFSSGMSLDSFEQATFASREIWQRVKTWLCGGSDATEAFGSESLRAAIVRHSTLRVEEVRFDDAGFVRAHAVVVDTRAAADSAQAWYVHLRRGQDAWRVTHASEETLLFATQ
jgi:hypothetical protein